MFIHLFPFIVTAFWSLGCIHPSTATFSTFTFRILDETGSPTPARVRFTDSAGQYFAPEGRRTDFPITSANDPISIEREVMMDNERRFAYIDGQFRIHLPLSKIRVEIVKGFDYTIHDEEIDLLKAENTLDIQLHKWTTLPDNHWYSGDVHVHFIHPETALMEMKAENLNVCNILISDFTVDHGLFRGDIEPISEPEHLIYMGQEFREDRLGHINLLNIGDKLIEPSQTPRQHQYPLNIYAMDEVHKNRGHVSWAHFAAWPGLEGPLAAIFRKVDAVELLCTIDPFHEPIFASDIIPEVRMNSGLRLWYRLLNCGLHIPATAGTDKMNNQVTVGANRVYAHVDSAFTYENWIKALNTGKTFVSNSPFLLFTVDGKGPGSFIDISAEKVHHIKAEVWSQLPIDRLEIIANGELVAEKIISKGESYAKLKISFQAEKSTWIAARAYQFAREDTRRGVSMAQRRDAGGGPTLFNQYFGTLRPETIFAHTSPVYLHLDGQPVRSAEDAAYFVHYLDNALHWLKDAGSFPSDAAKKEVLEAFQKGKEAFEALTK